MQRKGLGDSEVALLIMKLKKKKLPVHSSCSVLAEKQFPQLCLCSASWKSLRYLSCAELVMGNRSVKEVYNLLL